METSNEVKILSMLGEVNNKINNLEVELKGEIKGVREELKEEINGVREELKEEINGVREELKEEINGVKTELKGVKEELDGTKVELKGMKEIMFKNFAALADTQVTTYNKLNEMSDSLKNIEFRVGVTEAGVSLNAKDIQGIRNI